MARDIEQPKEEEWAPSANDRCDYDCPAQAMVQVSGVAGYLYFCSHHYNQIIKNKNLAKKINDFAFKIQDKSDILKRK